MFDKRARKDGMYRTVLITEKDDIISCSGTAKALEGLKGPVGILLHSQPCIGGMPVAGHQQTQRRSHKHELIQHYNLFRECWQSFEDIATEAITQ